MSELKATTAQEIVRNEKDCDYMDELFGGVKMPPTQVYIKSEADKVISTIRAERDEYRYNLSCARNEIHNLSMSMREDVKRIADKDKVIAELKADYKEACDRLQTANLIKDEQLAATRHSKRKRCLNKAEWCEERCARYDLLQEHSGFSWRREIDFYFRWYQRWLELAERFK